MVFAPEDSSEITWFKNPDSTFWAKSRLADPYVLAMTKSLLQKICDEVHSSLQLGPNVFQVSMMTLKKLDEVSCSAK